MPTAGLAGPASSTYAYDQAGWLTSWNNGTVTTQYGYDANGNLTRDGSKAYAYDARDELTNDGTASYGYTARGTPSSESGLSGTIAVTFDAYGDQAMAGTRSYTYDALGRLTADTPAAGGGGYQFSYAGSTGTIASDGVSAYTWDPSGSTLAGTGAAGGGSGVLALANVHGDVLGQFTASGSAVSGSQAYDPWGKVTAATGTPQGLLGFQSAWGDPASGKDLMGPRWYAPGSGDFTSADTVQVSPDPDPAAGNPFAYAGDEPLDLTDPTGHWSLGGLVKAALKKVTSNPVVKAVVKTVKSSPIVKAIVKKAAPVINVAKAALRTTRNISARVVDGQKTVLRTAAFTVTHPVGDCKLTDPPRCTTSS